MALFPKWLSRIDRNKQTARKPRNENSFTLESQRPPSLITQGKWRLFKNMAYRTRATSGPLNNALTR